MDVLTASFLNRQKYEVIRRATQCDIHTVHWKELTFTVKCRSENGPKISSKRNNVGHI